MEAFVSGRLTVQRCRHCGQLQHPSQPRCTGCGSADLDWHRCNGTGAVHSLVSAAERRGPPAGVPAIVELDEGLRITGNIVGCDAAEVRVGTRVEAVSAPGVSAQAVVNCRPATRTPAGARPMAVGGTIED